MSPDNCKNNLFSVKSKGNFSCIMETYRGSAMIANFFAYCA